MTETRRNRHPSEDDFVRETVRQILALRADGAVSPEDIATGLNRSGFPDRRGRQWNGAAVMAFLGSPEAERAQRELG